MFHHVIHEPGSPAEQDPPDGPDKRKDSGVLPAAAISPFGKIKEAGSWDY